MDPRSGSSPREHLTRYGAAAAPHVDLAFNRGRTSLRARRARLRAKAWQIGQCAVAAGVAWTIASDVFDHPTPFFAPIAAVVSLGISYGQRLRRVAEVTVGVAIGVFVGDLLTHWLGSGGWQIALIVSLAMTAALLLGQGVLFVNQAAVQAIVVSTLVPTPDAAFIRWTDALIGGGVALVAAAVVPRAPLRRPREQAAVVMRKISQLLRAASQSIVEGDVERALSMLQDARAHRRARRRAPRRLRRGPLRGALLAVPATASWTGAGDGRARRAAGLRAAKHPGARTAGGGGELPPRTDPHVVRRAAGRPRRLHRHRRRRARCRSPGRERPAATGGAGPGDDASWNGPATFRQR